MNEAEINAKKKLERIFFKWMDDDTILLETYCMMNKVADPSQETIGIDVRGRVPCIKYNPNFINSLSLEHLEMVLVMEGFKILLRHCTTRLLEPRQISALASEITIGQLLNSDLRYILGGIDDIAPSVQKFKLDSGESFESYFGTLKDRLDDIDKQINKMWGSLSDEQKDKLLNSGEGEGEGEIPKDSEGFRTFENEKDALKNYTDPNGTSCDGWGDNKLFDAEMKEMITKNKDKVKKWGKHTGNAVGEIVSAYEPKINPKEIIRRFGRSIKCENVRRSRMKVNRRYDLLFSGKKRTYKSKIIFAIDASGSMSDDDLKEGYAVINSILGKKGAEIVYVLFDTKIKHIEKDLKKARTSFKVYGRGGTDFQEVCDFADKEKCDGIVIYTDGFANSPIQPKAKVLWLMTDKDKNPPVKWGFVSYLKRNEDTRTI